MNAPTFRRLSTTPLAYATLIFSIFWYACASSTDPGAAPDDMNLRTGRDHKGGAGIFAEDFRLETPESDPTFFGEMRTCAGCHGPIYNRQTPFGLTYWDANGNYLGWRDSSTYYYPTNSGHPQVDGVDIRE